MSGSPQKRLNVAATSDNMQDLHLLAFNAVDDDVLANGKGSQSGSQVENAAAAYTRMPGEQKNRSVMESISRSAMSKLPLLVAM